MELMRCVGINGTGPARTPTAMDLPTRPIEQYLDILISMRLFYYGIHLVLFSTFFFSCGFG